MKKKVTLLLVAVIGLIALNIFEGSIRIPAGDVLDILLGRGEGLKPSWRYIVLESRLPQAVTALCSGAALAVSGLLLQTAFRNPLADPSIFGISSGAGLGVALVMLLLGGSLSLGSLQFTGFIAVIVAAFVGAMAVTAVILFFSTIVRSNVMLLIIGIMTGYLTSSAITLLNFFATDEGVKSYMVWGMGSFGGVTLSHLPLFVGVSMLGILGALLLIKPLNALMLGDRYAENLGISIRRSFWRRGYAEETLKEVVDYLSENEKIGCVKGWCAADNTGSRKAMEKAGMKLVRTETAGLSVNGKAYDKLYYERRRDQEDREDVDAE